jgi:hypothetical protein
MRMFVPAGRDSPASAEASSWARPVTVGAVGYRPRRRRSRPAGASKFSPNTTG